MDGTSRKPTNLDDKDYIANFFSKLVSPKVGGLGSRLRGGQRDISKTWSDGEVEIKHEHPEDSVLVQGQTHTHMEIKEEDRGSNIDRPANINSTTVKVESPDPRLEQWHKYVPLEEHEISQASYGPRTAKLIAFPVVSVADRRGVPQQVESTGSINKLDFEPETQQFTPTQMSIMDRIAEGTSSVRTRESDSSPEVSNRAEIMSPTKTPVNYGPQTFYDKILESHTRQAKGSTHDSEEMDILPAGRVPTPLDPRAEEFQSSTPVPQEQGGEAVHETKPFVVTFVEDAAVDTLTPASIPEAESVEPTAPIEQAADTFLAEEQDVRESELNIPHTPCAREAEIRSEGGLDITPMLKALGARHDGVPAVETVTEANHVAPVPLQATVCAYAQEITVENKTRVDQKLTTKVDASLRSRVVVIEPLPSDVDYDMLASLIRGGQIEAMKISQVTMSARVSFVEMDDASKFVVKHDTGLTLRHHGREHKASVRLSPESEELDAVVEAYIRCGATRIIEVENIADEQSINALYNLAQGVFRREIESITDTYKLANRITTFRFANLRDAVEFRDMLMHKKEWEGLTLRFARDPCEEEV